jgi:hypothetical protein
MDERDRAERGDHDDQQNGRAHWRRMSGPSLDRVSTGTVWTAESGVHDDAAKRQDFKSIDFDV